MSYLGSQIVWRVNLSKNFKKYFFLFFILHKAVPLIKLMMPFDVLYQLAES